MTLATSTKVLLDGQPLNIRCISGLEAFQDYLNTLAPKDGSNEIFFKHGHGVFYVGDWDVSGEFPLWATRKTGEGAETRIRTHKVTDNAYTYLRALSELPLEPDADGNVPSGGVFTIPTQPIGYPGKGAIDSTDDLGCEMDNRSKDEQIAIWQSFTSVTGIEPATLLSSGGKSVHGHIKLDRHYPLEEADYLRRLLCLGMIGDAAVVNVHQPMRVPGFFRSDKGTEQDLLFTCDRRYTFDAVFDGLRAWFEAEGMPFPERISDEWWIHLKRSLKTAEKGNRQPLMDALSEGIDEWERKLNAVREASQQRRLNASLDSTKLIDAVKELSDRLGDSAFDRRSHAWSHGFSKHKRGNCTFHESTSGSAWLSQSNGQWLFNCQTCGKGIDAFRYWFSDRRGSIPNSYPKGKEWAASAKEFLADHGVTYVDDWKPSNPASNWGEPDLELYEVHEVRTEEEQENEATAQRERERARKEAYKAETDRIQKALNSLTYPITQELNQRYLSGIEPPQKGEILAISSDCNTGKTTQNKEFVTDWRSRHPDGAVIMIGGRNALLMQTGAETGIPHIQELDRWYRNNLRFALQQEKAVALCIDSLHRINLDWLPENTLIILDEGEATLQQALEGGTLGSRQNEALEHFRAVLNTVRERNGAILATEDALTDLSLNFLNEATYSRYSLRLVVNRHQSEPWDVTIGAGSVSGLVARLRGLLEAGQKVLLTTDSQIFGEAVDRMFGADCKNVRIDTLTVEDPVIAAFRPNPDAFITSHKPDLMSLTPIVQSGVSITNEHFDINLHYASHLEARLQNQLLNRDRPPVPREIYCAAFAPSEGGNRGLRPAQILKDWSIKARSTLMRSQVETFIKDGLESWDDAEPTKKRLEAIDTWKKAEADSPALFWARHAANFKARQNGSKCQLLKSLTETLESKGHRVTDKGGWEIDRSEIKQLSGAKEAIRRGRAADQANADTTGLNVEKARRILNSNDSLYADRCKAHKVLLMDELPGVNLTPEFVLEAVINHNGALKRATTLLFLTEHPEIATYLDRQSFKGQLDKPFVAVWRLSHKRSTVEVLLLTGVKALMSLDEYQESDEVIAALKVEALKHRFEIKRYLGLNIDEDQTGIHIVSKLLKKLGYKQVLLRREGARGEQTRIWQALPLNQDISDDIIKALETKWAEQISAGSHHFSREESVNKMETTEPQISADWFSDDSLESIRAMWKGCKSDEIRLYMEKHIPIEALRGAIA